MNVAKTKALISCTVTAQLICVFIFAYAKSRFTQGTAHMICTFVLCIYARTRLYHDKAYDNITGHSLTKKNIFFSTKQIQELWYVQLLY